MSNEIPDIIREQLSQTATVVNPNTGDTWEGKLLGYLEQPSVELERADGTRISLPASWLQKKLPLRERVARLLDDAHGPCVTEGGCDFRALSRSGRQYGQELRVDEIVDQIIALVQAEEPNP